MALPSTCHESTEVAEPDNDEQYVYRSAHKIASKIEKDMESYSRIFDPARQEAVPKFDRDEITLGDVLGTGGFNDVFALHQISLSKKLHRQCSEEQQVKRENGARRSKGGKNYAIKLLRPSSCLEGEQGYLNGAADLVVETKILANIEPHRNIIQLHGVSAAGTAGFAQGVEGGYFLIVDRLHDTLDKRLISWRENKKSLTDRLLVALELASALKHLHSYNVIFRDLKPDNIGFDAEGTLKLFDFGLAKELDPRELTTNDTYEMSGQTGSRRYMAPEVVLSQPYNLTADVYSFALVTWQMCSLQVPFGYIDTEEHLKSIVLGNERPVINPEWPAKIGNIMKWSWADQAAVRPSMREVFKALKRQLKAELLKPQQETQTLLQAWPSSDRSYYQSSSKPTVPRIQSMRQLQGEAASYQQQVDTQPLKACNRQLRRQSLPKNQACLVSERMTRRNSLPMFGALSSSPPPPPPSCDDNEQRKTYSLASSLNCFQSKELMVADGCTPLTKKRSLKDMLSSALIITTSDNDQIIS